MSGANQGVWIKGKGLISRLLVTEDRAPAEMGFDISLERRQEVNNLVICFSFAAGIRSKAKTILRLAALEQSKNAVLHSLGAASSQESYGHATDEFIGWYWSQPRLAFNRTVVLRYRFFLEQKNLAPSTINVRLAAVRRLAYEASDTGLLSPDLAAGIRRVKGAKRLGARIGNWLTVDQSRTLLGEPRPGSLRGKRDRALLPLLIGSGLRRATPDGLETEDFQIREERCVIADLVGKGKHIRTVPVPLCAKRPVDVWIMAAAIHDGATL